MTICSQCGLEIKEGAHFCKACGHGAPGADTALDRKKAQVLAVEKSKSRTLIIAAGVVFAALAVLYFAAPFSKHGAAGSFMQSLRKSGSVRPSAMPVAASNGEIRIPEESLQGTGAAFYVYSVGGRNIRFFLLRAPDGTVRSALDACTSCYRAKEGYRQERDNMVCNNCGMAFRAADIGVITGGCNPIPIAARTDGGMLVIRSSELEAGAKYF